jgi:hypothetical protein
MHMSKRRLPPKRARTNEMVIGRRRFAAISAVEGIKLTPEMEARVAEFDRTGMTPEERVRAIVAAHRKQ